MINNLSKLGMLAPALPPTSLPSAAHPPRKRARFIVVGGVAVIGLILTLAALGNPDSRVSSSRSEATGSVATAKESAAHVSATLLYDQYRANEVNADDYYRDRLVAVSGKVAGINKYFSDSTYVELETSNEFESVQAHLANGQAEKASALYKGASVVVVCRGAGMFVGSPELIDCSIQ
jgi:tRNA_anti-like